MPYYTNSSHLPVGYTESVSEALEIQDKLQVLYTSGTVFHAFLGQKLQDWKIAANIVRKIAENYQLPYFTMSPTYSICPEHGYISGEHFSCPTCDGKTEVYSRITGYYRPIQNWNDGKKAEFLERKEYVLDEKDYVDESLTTKIIAQVDHSNDQLSNKKFLLFTTRNLSKLPLCQVSAR